MDLANYILHAIMPTCTQCLLTSSTHPNFSNNIKHNIKNKSITDKPIILKNAWRQVLSLMTKGQVVVTLCWIFWLPKKEEEDIFLAFMLLGNNSLGSQLNFAIRHSFWGGAAAQNVTSQLKWGYWRTVILSCHLLEFHCSFVRGTIMRISSFYHVGIVEQVEPRNIAKRRGGTKAKGASHTPVCCRSRTRSSRELH